VVGVQTKKILQGGECGYFLEQHFVKAKVPCKHILLLTTFTQIYPLHLIASPKLWLVIQMRGRDEMVAPTPFLLN